STFGKWAWQMKLETFVKEELGVMEGEVDKDRVVDKDKVDDKIGEVVDKVVEKRDNVVDVKLDVDDNVADACSKDINEMIENENKILKLLENCESKINKPPPVDSSGHMATLLMAQLGFLSSTSRKEIIPIPLNDRLNRELDELESLKDKICSSCSIFYAPIGSKSSKDLFEPESSIPADFSNFLSSIGILIDIKSHIRFKGNLDSKFCKLAPYYSNRNYEIIFNVPLLFDLDSLLKKSDVSTSKSVPNLKAIDMDDDSNTLMQELDSSKLTKKPSIYHAGSSRSLQTISSFTNPHSIYDSVRKILKDDPTCIVWIEDESDIFNLKPLLSSLCSYSTCIFVQPLFHDLFRIKVCTLDPSLKDDSICFGPAVDGAVVDKSILGSLLQMAVISATTSVLVDIKNQNPLIARKKFLDELFATYKQFSISSCAHVPILIRENDEK
ncbi:hypothetical protein ROZALSC1DRAFT_25440, partial [Rozella allomycis CSF55]